MNFNKTVQCIPIHHFHRKLSLGLRPTTLKFDAFPLRKAFTRFGTLPRGKIKRGKSMGPLKAVPSTDCYALTYGEGVGGVSVKGNTASKRSLRQTDERAKRYEG